MKALGGEPYPGLFKGKHYTAYVEQVKQLKRDGDLDGSEQLLLALVDVIETEARIRQDWNVAPWYYEELAKLYRQRKDYAAEVTILQRYMRLAQASRMSRPSSSLGQLQERLTKAQALLMETQR